MQPFCAVLVLGQAGGFPAVVLIADGPRARSRRPRTGSTRGQALVPAHQPGYLPRGTSSGCAAEGWGLGAPGNGTLTRSGCRVGTAGRKDTGPGAGIVPAGGCSGLGRTGFRTADWFFRQNIPGWWRDGCSSWPTWWGAFPQITQLCGPNFLLIEHSSDLQSGLEWILEGDLLTSNHFIPDFTEPCTMSPPPTE